MSDIGDAQSWLNDRMRSGNWLDVLPNEDIPESILGWDRTIAHMFQVAFAPEIRRRLDSGELDDNFILLQAQMIQPLEGRNFVRLNDEVKGQAFINLSRPVEKGDPVMLSEMENLERFELLEEEIDSGHFSIFFAGRGWVGAFDFRTGKGRALSWLDAAEQFLEHARSASAAQHHGPAIDNLFSASELVAKSILITSQHPAGQKKGHGIIHSGINNWRRLGNVDGAFVDLFNRLANLRPRARYMADTSVPLPTDDDLQIVSEMLAKMRALYGTSHR